MNRNADRYRYGLRQTIPPAEEPISIERARRNCSIDDGTHDDALNDLIQDAREYCEEHTDVCLLTSTWQWTFDCFPSRGRSLEVPRWPAQSIDSISYIDTAGDTQTIDAQDIRLRIDDFGRGRLALGGWAAWPATKSTPDAVTITFRAGWTTIAEIPSPWRRAQLMLIAWWFEQREAGVYGQAAKAPIGVDDLIQSAATADDFEDFDLGDD